MQTGLAFGGEDGVDDLGGAGVVRVLVPDVVAEPLAVALVLCDDVVDGLAGVLAALEQAEVGAGDALGLGCAAGFCLLPRDAVNVVQAEVDHTTEPGGRVMLAQVSFGRVQSLLLISGQVADVHAGVVGLGLNAKLGLGVAGAGAVGPERVEPSLVAGADGEMADADQVAVRVGEDDHMYR